MILVDYEFLLLWIGLAVASIYAHKTGWEITSKKKQSVRFVTVTSVIFHFISFFTDGFNDIYRNWIKVVNDPLSSVRLERRYMNKIFEIQLQKRKVLDGWVTNTQRLIIIWMDSYWTNRKSQRTVNVCCKIWHFFIEPCHWMMQCNRLIIKEKTVLNIFIYFSMSFPVAEEALENNIDAVDDIVNPWEVIGNKLTGIDYDKLIRMWLFTLRLFSTYNYFIKVVLVHQKFHLN